MLIRPDWNLCMVSVNHLMLVINASINFLIYCSIGMKFKLVLKRVLVEQEKDSARLVVYKNVKLMERSMHSGLIFLVVNPHAFLENINLIKSEEYKPKLLSKP